MTPTAVLFGSIGVLAETSDIQRRAYNQALAEAGVDWHWEPDTYRDLLTKSGGKKRLTRLSEAEGGSLTQAQIDTIHARKTEIACAEVAQGISLRPGVERLIGEALDAEVPIALVTSTYRPNIDAIATGAGGSLPLDKFAAVLTTEDCAQGKPSPEVYEAALQRLSIAASGVVAIEDSQPSVQAAKAAQLFTLATPGQFTSTQDFSAADQVYDSLEALRLDDLLNP
ncbi:MAG: HAD-IA family hydrolase [Pseudomonadota bacterium]